LVDGDVVLHASTTRLYRTHCSNDALHEYSFHTCIPSDCGKLLVLAYVTILRRSSVYRPGFTLHHWRPYSWFVSHSDRNEHDRCRTSTEQYILHQVSQLLHQEDSLSKRTSYRCCGMLNY